MTLRSRFSLALLVGLALIWSAGCTLDKQDAPPFIGPSGLGLSVTMSATPDVLPRDGASVSTIQLIARDESGNPKAGQHFLISATAGVLTEDDVVTDSAGQKTFGFTAPGLSADIKVVEITATPVGTNFDNSVTRRVLSIRVVGPGFPKADFSFTPEEPGQFDLVTFDASATLLEGAACGSACSYAWDFGDGTSGTGLFTSHRFESQGTFRVTLLATSAGGTSDTLSKTVTVGAAKALTAVITSSPTNPLVDEPVTFDGLSSTTPDGVPIVDYSWDFGNGTTASGATASTVFTTTRTYTVRLTIRDAAGRKGTAVKEVTPAEEPVGPEPPPPGAPLTAAFTISPTDPLIGQTVSVNGTGSSTAPGETITSYAWDFGNMLTGAGATATTTYATAQTFSIQLTVTDSLGRTNTLAQTVTVVAP